MKISRIQIALVVTVVLLLLVVSIAVARGNSKTGVLPPNNRVQGNTDGEWSAIWWQHVFAIPASQNPLMGVTGDSCVVDQVGNVALVFADPQAGQTIHCQVPLGTKLYLDIVSIECSTLEPDPFHGENEAELRACALGFTITDLQAAIDGQPVKNLERYIHDSPLFDLTMPEDNILEVPAGSTGQSVSNGAHLMLNPLSPGTHTVNLHAYVPDVDFTVDLNYEFTASR
jgi:hypothetical protein